MKERVQKFGRFLSGMVMPNIGAFIAWGLIAAFFIEAGSNSALTAVFVRRSWACRQWSGC